MATVTIRPNGDGSVSAYVKSNDSGTPLYSYIDEETLDTGDYLLKSASQVTRIKQSFEWSSSSLTSEVINKIEVHLVTNGSAGTIYVFFGDSDPGTYGYDYDDVDNNNYRYEFTENPSTSDSWTVSDIENLYCGFNISKTPKLEVNVYQMYIVVDYDEGVSTNIATIDGLAYASVATFNGLAMASASTINGLA